MTPRIIDGVEYVPAEDYERLAACAAGLTMKVAALEADLLQISRIGHEFDSVLDKLAGMLGIQLACTKCGFSRSVHQYNAEGASVCPQA